MEIEPGWCLFSADFSCQAMGSRDEGSVTFIRDAAGRKAWHILPESIKENDANVPPLYVYGTGVDIEDAIISANIMAAHAIPILSDKCRKCGGEMREGVAMGQTVTGKPDFIGSDEVCTVSPGGSGKVIGCRKCVNCGWSVTK